MVVHQFSGDGQNETGTEMPENNITYGVDMLNNITVLGTKDPVLNQSTGANQSFRQEDAAMEKLPNLSDFAFLCENKNQTGSAGGQCRGIPRDLDFLQRKLHLDITDAEFNGTR